MALTSPDVAGLDGDGLLTMEKILGLKLDADWVVLSACNTAAGNGAGAEAVSGLGRAFFYAGARALLVTHWPVETTSARALTTQVFKRQAAEPQLDAGGYAAAIDAESAGWARIHRCIRKSSVCICPSHLLGTIRARGRWALTLRCCDPLRRGLRAEQPAHRRRPARSGTPCSGGRFWDPTLKRQFDAVERATSRSAR